MLVDEHQLERDDTGVSAVRPEADSVSLPPTIHALLAARLDRLEPGERAALEAGAVVGRSFGRGAAVLELSRSGDRPELDAHLRAARAQAADRARRRALRGRGHVQLHPQPRARRRLRRDAQGGRADLPRALRGLARVGDAESGRASTRRSSGTTSSARTVTWPSSDPVDERGRELAPAPPARLGSSGRRALARGDIPPAMNLLERAVSLLAEDDPARRDLTIKLGVALAETGQMSRAGALLHDRIEAEQRGRASWCSTTAPASSTWWTSARTSPRSPSAGGIENHVSLSWDDEVSRRHASAPPRRGLDARGRRVPQRLVSATASG